MNKNVKSALIAAVIFGVIIAMFTARRAATESEAELYGNWQMTDASWQTELASRQYGLTAYCVSNIIFCAPSGFSSDARFIAFDRTTVNQGHALAAISNTTETFLFAKRRCSERVWRASSG